ncbi:MAG: hypothetical protein HY696_03605 [Deltaproteobacteria bacterium]|nr:hypothetical protein [Deltaproteobacteria bacterium]
MMRPSRTWLHWLVVGCIVWLVSGTELRADPDDDVPETNVADLDTDGDGIPNPDDPDIDGDGTTNLIDSDDDGDGVPDNADPDSDQNGVSD